MTQAEAQAQPLALKGVKVLELGALIAGPYASTLLAQFGAEVIKIEPPGKGDPLRTWRKLHKGTSLWWYTQSRNKKSVTLDLKHPEAQEIVRKLAAEADVVIENFRPGTLEKWGLGWETLHALNPSLIMVRISGYGQTGPASQKPGFAAIAECMGGLRYVTGYPDRAPVRTGVSLGDTLASLYAVVGALIAMHHVKVNRGKGQMIDVALYEAVFAVMESLIPEYSVGGNIRERTGSALPGIVPSNTYLCQDGSYVAIAGNGDGIFKRLMAAIGRPDLAEDPALAQNDGRAKQTEMIDGVIAAWTAQHTLDHILETLDAASVPCGRIYTAKDIYEDAHYRARDMIQSFELPDGQAVDLPGIVPKLSETPGQTRWLGPELGAHTEEVLARIGVTPEQYAQMREAGLA
ncbi:CaiB/BaiF CoA-transferase family protein [Pusillimonas sp. NJUB218]|uniref:CaiB/BaiF CoA transferase family protein n=1 Tax=Pusillimonas sp. NJUB218 TaxID=2023230 RepID=UPI000F4CCC87|nr:CoA transferase [Pusillimonas sp. NJUB218]ROT44083.1 carnitine dehydratase [Pusillimonas sp. NJUB218]